MVLVFNLGQALTRVRVRGVLRRRAHPASRRELVTKRRVRGRPVVCMRDWRWRHVAHGGA